MVIEGIVTTENEDGSLHIAPIGPHVNDSLTEWILKPFQTSNSFKNLHRQNRGVFHVVDDALFMALAVMGLCNHDSDEIDKIQTRVSLTTFEHIAFCLTQLQNASFDPLFGWFLPNANRIFALTIDCWDVSLPRAIATCSVVEHREPRPAWGWNRAKHSILELSVVASRISMLDPTVVKEEFDRHRVIIEKTAGPTELAALELLQVHLTQ